MKENKTSIKTAEEIWNAAFKATIQEIYNNMPPGQPVHAEWINHWIKVPKMPDEFKPLPIEEVKEETNEAELWRELIDTFDVADKSSYGYATVMNALKSKFTIKRK